MTESDVLHSAAVTRHPSRITQLNYRRAAYILVFLTLLFFALIRVRLREMPLERDEGEYALSGQLMLQGIPPYQLAYNLKLPGTYAAYAVILAMFGQTPTGIHLGFLLVNAATILLMFLLGARLFGLSAGLIASGTYGLLSASPGILGFQAHATHFIVLPALVSILLLLRALESGRSWQLVGSGLFAGIAFLMKQHGVFVPVFCFLYLVVQLRRNSPLSAGLKPPSPQHRGDWLRYPAWFVLGVILPIAITLLLLYRSGVFSQFWFWTVSYAGEYSKMGLRRGIRVFLQNFREVAGSTALLWGLAGLGILALWHRSTRKHRWFVLVLLLLAFLAICPGVQFRPHYFVLLLPAISLLVSAAWIAATEIASTARAEYLVVLPTLAFLACFASAIWQERTFYFRATPEAAMQAAYPSDAKIFLAAPRVAQYIREHSSASSRLVVIGSEPELYFYAHRLPATGYIYMYSLIERQKYTDPMRKQMIQEIEGARPDYLVYVDAWDSWGYQDSSAPHVIALFSWAKNYIRENYDQIGVADLDASTRYDFIPRAGENIRHTSAIYLFKRRTAPPN